MSIKFTGWLWNNTDTELGILRESKSLDGYFNWDPEQLAWLKVQPGQLVAFTSWAGDPIRGKMTYIRASIQKKDGNRWDYITGMELQRIDSLEGTYGKIGLYHHYFRGYYKSLDVLNSGSTVSFTIYLNTDDFFSKNNKNEIVAGLQPNKPPPSEV